MIEATIDNQDGSSVEPQYAFNRDLTLWLEEMALQRRREGNGAFAFELQKLAGEVSLIPPVTAVCPICEKNTLQRFGIVQQCEREYEAGYRYRWRCTKCGELELR